MSISTVPQLEIFANYAVIRLNAPAQANRLSPTDLQVLREHIAKVNDQTAVMVLLIKAEGRYFCSGYDLQKLGSDTAPSSLYFGETMDVIEQARPITIAVVQGGAYGGGTDLCLACDFRVGSTEANMFMPATRLGLHFYPGGLKRYISRIGLNNTKDLFFTGRRIDAAEMRTMGVLTHLCEPQSLETEVMALTEQISTMAPIPLYGVKRHVNLMANAVFDETDIAEQVLRSERSEDLKEGGAAWREKRAAKFIGR